MRRIALTFLVLVAATAAVAQVQTDPNRSRTTATTFRVVGLNEDVDQNAFEVVAENPSYAALAAKDSMNILSSSASDLQKVRVRYIKVDSTRKDTTLALNGTTAVTFGDSVLHFESAWVDSGAEAVGTLTIRRKSTTTVTTILPGKRSTSIAHRFAAELEKVYLTRWMPSVYTVGDTTTAGKYALRWDQNATRDSLIGAGGDTTVIASIQGADVAGLVAKVTVIEGDQTDTIRVLAQISQDGTNFSAYVAIDSLLVTAADAAIQTFYLDLRHAEITAAFGNQLFLAPYVRFAFLPKSLDAADTLAVEPVIVRAASQGFDGARVQLRVYKEFAQILDSGDGYEVIDEVFLTPSGQASRWRDLEEPVLVPQYGYFAVFAQGKTDNRKVFVAIEGYEGR